MIRHPCSDDSRWFGDVLRRCMGPVHTARARDRGVLLVCWDGHNRAPAIAIGLLMVFDGLRLTEAAADVVRYRGRVLSDVAIRRQLAVLACQLRETGRQAALARRRLEIAGLVLPNGPMPCLGCSPLSCRWST
jgi:protein-tyrosine phosphatase